MTCCLTCMWCCQVKDLDATHAQSTKEVEAKSSKLMRTAMSHVRAGQEHPDLEESAGFSSLILSKAHMVVSRAEEDEDAAQEDSEEPDENAQDLGESQVSAAESESFGLDGRSLEQLQKGNMKVAAMKRRLEGQPSELGESSASVPLIQISMDFEYVLQLSNDDDSRRSYMDEGSESDEDLGEGAEISAEEVSSRLWQVRMQAAGAPTNIAVEDPSQLAPKSEHREATSTIHVGSDYGEIGSAMEAGVTTSPTTAPTQFAITYELVTDQKCSDIGCGIITTVEDCKKAAFVLGDWPQDNDNFISSEEFAHSVGYPVSVVQKRLPTGCSKAKPPSGSYAGKIMGLVTASGGAGQECSELLVTGALGCACMCGAGVEVHVDPLVHPAEDAEKLANSSNSTENMSVSEQAEGVLAKEYARRHNEAEGKILFRLQTDSKEKGIKAENQTLNADIEQNAEERASEQKAKRATWDEHAEKVNIQKQNEMDEKSRVSNERHAKSKNFSTWDFKLRKDYDVRVKRFTEHEATGKKASKEYYVRAYKATARLKAKKELVTKAKRKYDETKRVEELQLDRKESHVKVVQMTRPRYSDRHRTPCRYKKEDWASKFHLSECLHAPTLFDVFFVADATPAARGDGSGIDGASHGGREPASANATFVGCYRDCFGGRDLPVYKGKGTRYQCAQRCQGYKYIGHQGDQECRCGNSYGWQGRVDGCRCEADFIGYCRQCVFQIAPDKYKASDPARDTDSGYVGCYKDGYGGHDLPEYKVFIPCLLSID